jgi:pyridoxamine 5'-phosphate oxidase
MPNGDFPVALNKADLVESPLQQFQSWFEEAQAARDIVLPDAMTLATAAKDGRPAARIVMLRGYDERGFVFFTSTESPKASELSENPRGELLFYWEKLERQVRIAGMAAEVSHEEAETYFQSRPKAHQLAALASEQSQVIDSREALESRFDELREEYRDNDIPMPPFWGGYRLSPDTFEFWQGHPSRLHDRFRYTRQPDGVWLIERLAP